MFSKESIYVHYGSTSFDIKRFERVENSNYLSKPINGGLWASEEESEKGWSKINSIRPQDKYYFKFKLANSSKVLMLDNREILLDLPKIISKIKDYPIILDFEKLSEEYDVIYYKFNEEMNRVLPSWDCDCILVMNPEVINELK